MANYNEVINKYAEANGLSKADSKRVIDSVFSTIKDLVVTDGKADVANFGSFSVKTRAARVGRNPRTGEALEIAAKSVPDFRAAKALKDAVVA